MSHAATNWAIQQRGLKPTTKIVLWHLSDRFNPDFGCFPTQERLAQDCEIGRATLNRHLDELEARGLIRRVRIIDTKTGQQRPTRYLLGFELNGLSKGTSSPEHHHDDTTRTPPQIVENPCPDLRDGSHDATPIDSKEETPSAPTAPCLDTGHGPVSHIGAPPCLKNGHFRVSKWDTNPVREPLSKPVKEEEDAPAREAVSDLFFGKLMEALGFAPNTRRPGWWQGSPAREHVRRWRDDLGLSEVEILQCARDSRETHPAPPDGPKALDRIMARAAQAKTPQQTTQPRRSRGSGQDQPSAKSSAPLDAPTMYADWVKSGKYLPPSAITNGMRDQMLARGLVTPEQLQERGVQ